MLSDKVIMIDETGARRATGLSIVLPVCDFCGAVLADQKRHDDWHDEISEEIRLAQTLAQVEDDG